MFPAARYNFIEIVTQGQGLHFYPVLVTVLCRPNAIFNVTYYAFTLCRASKLRGATEKKPECYRALRSPQ